MAEWNGKGGGVAQPHSLNLSKDWSGEPCWFCDGYHLSHLRGRAQCPNTVAEANGTAESNKKHKVRCTYWIDSNKNECGGSHSFEDHKAALAQFRPKGKGGGKRKEKDSGKGKQGRGKDKLGG